MNRKLLLICTWMTLGLTGQVQAYPQAPAPWIEEIRPDLRNVRGLNYLPLYPDVPAPFAQGLELSSTSFLYYYDGYYYTNDPVGSPFPQPHASEVEKQLRWMKEIGVNSIRVWMSYPLWKFHNDFLSEPNVNPSTPQNEYLKKLDDFLALCEALNMHVIPVMWGSSVGYSSYTFSRFGNGKPDPVGLGTPEYPNTSGSPATQMFNPNGTGDFDVHWHTGNPIYWKHAQKAVEVMALRGWHGNPGTALLDKWSGGQSTGPLNSEATAYIEEVVGVLASSPSTLMIDIMNEPVFSTSHQFLINGTISTIRGISGNPAASGVKLTIGAGGPSFRFQNGNPPFPWESLPLDPDMDVISAHPYIAFREGMEQWVKNTAGYRENPVGCPQPLINGECYSFAKPVLVSETAAPGEGTSYADSINLCLNVPRPDLGAGEKGVGFMIWTTMLSPAIPLAAAEGMFYIDGEVRNLAACQAFIDAAVAQGVDRSQLTLPRAKAVNQGSISDPSGQLVFQNQLPFSVGYDDYEFLSRKLNESDWVVSYPPGAPIPDRVAALRVHSIRLHEIVHAYIALHLHLKRVQEVYASSPAGLPAYVNFPQMGSTNASLTFLIDNLVIARDVMAASAQPFHPDVIDYQDPALPAAIDSWGVTMQSMAQALKLLRDWILVDLQSPPSASLTTDPSFLLHGPYTSLGVNVLDNGGADINQHGLLNAIFDKPAALEVASWLSSSQAAIQMSSATAEYGAPGSLSLPPGSQLDNHRYFTSPAAGGATLVLNQQQLLWDLDTEIVAEQIGFELKGAFKSGTNDAQLELTFMTGTGVAVSPGGVHTIGSSSQGVWELNSALGRVPGDASKMLIELSLPPGSASDDLSLELVQVVGANRLSNPGGEVLFSRDCGDTLDNQIPGWEDSSGSVLVQDYCSPGAQPAELGLARFHGGVGFALDETRSISQRVSLEHVADWIDDPLELVTADLSAWLATLSGADEVEVILTFEDGGNPAVITPGTSLAIPTSSTLTQATSSIAIPSGSRWAVVEVAFTERSGNSLCDAVADEISLVIQH